jgi:HSP20 family protein
MTLVKYSPTRAFGRNFFDDTVVRDFFNGFNTAAANNSAGSHRFNVSKTETGFEITAGLPGVKREELTMEVAENVLVISYKHAEGETANRFVSEFTQKYQLGDSIDQDSVEASLTDGVLTVSLKKLPEPETAKPKAIEIK